MPEESGITVGVILDLEPADPHDPATALRVGGRLFVEMDGIRHLAEAGAMGVVFGDRKDATQACLEEDIDYMLGRAKRRPPVLAWCHVRSVLDREAIDLTDEALAAMPLVFELSPELLAELDG